jgi:hypothetical protein
MKKDYVPYEVGTEFFNIIYINFMPYILITIVYVFNLLKFI